MKKNYVEEELCGIILETIINKFMNILENTKYTKTNLDNSTLKIDFEVSKALYDFQKNKSLTKMSKEVTLEGFRKGNAPIDQVEVYLGASLIEDLLNSLVPQVTAEVIVKEDLKPMDQVKYEVTDIDPTESKGYSIKYSATFTNLPEIKLPVLEELKVAVSLPKEVNAEDIERVKKQYEDRIKNLEEAAQEEGKEISETDKKIPSDEEIKAQLTEQNAHENDQKYKSEVIRTVCDNTKLEFPDNLVGPETSAREKSYISRIEQLGLKVEDFLKMQNTTIEQLREIWQKEARESILVALVLGQVVRDYKIEISESEIKEELDNIKEFSNEEEKLRVIDYIRSVKLQQKALEFIISKIQK